MKVIEVGVACCGSYCAVKEAVFDALCLETGYSGYADMSMLLDEPIFDSELFGLYYCYQLLIRCWLWSSWGLPRGTKWGLIWGEAFTTPWLC